MVTAILQLLVAGIGTGSIYALIALGFNVVFKSTGAMNFAQGEWVVMGGMVSALLFSAFSNIGLACLVAVLIVTIVGILSERLVIWPLRRPTTLMITLVSIGLAICSRSLVMLVLGKQPVGYPGFSQTAMLTGAASASRRRRCGSCGLTAAFLLVDPSVFRAQHYGQGAAGGGGRSRGGGYRRRAGRDHGAAVVCDRRLCRRTGRRHHHAADAVVL